MSCQRCLKEKSNCHKKNEEYSFVVKSHVILQISLGCWESSNYLCLWHEYNFLQFSSGRYMTRFKFRLGVTWLQKAFRVNMKRA